jgi:hypothetical protein
MKLYFCKSSQAYCTLLFLLNFMLLSLPPLTGAFFKGDNIVDSILRSTCLQRFARTISSLTAPHSANYVKGQYNAHKK